MSHRKSNWIPWAFAGALGVVVAVNGALVYFATTTFSGIAVDRPYQRGLEYNRVIDEAAHQAAIGWSIEVEWRVIDRAAMTGTLEAHVTHRGGKPVDGLKLAATVIRPVEQVVPAITELDQVGPGRYAATLTLPKHGLWDAHVVASSGNMRVETDARIVVP